MNWKRILLLFPGLLILSPQLGAQEADSTAVSVPQREAKPSLEELCELLVSEEQRVEALLGTVVDKASANKAAEQLEQLFKTMSSRLQQLQSYPISGDDDALIIKTHMASLTRISQICLTTMRRLYEVNAYGSEQLMKVFRMYGVDTSTTSGVLQAEDLPYTELYNKLSDQVGNILFVLRKIKDNTAAAEAINTLREQAEQMEHTKRMLTLLDPPRTDEQKEAVLPTMERLRHLREELLALRSDLQSVEGAAMAQLMDLLERILVASAG